MVGRRLRPSPSMVVAFVALFMAIGGGSYALAQLPSRSVGSTQLKRGAELILMYDGLRQHDYKTNRISARHKRKTFTNILLADAHAEGVPSKSLPDLTEAEMKGTDLSVFAKTAYPRWRLDQ